MVFCGLNQLNFSKSQNMVLLLESPHKDEFSSIGVPLKPASGITGTKINTKFGDIITNSANSNTLNVSHSYMIKYVVPKLFKECANRGFLERVDDHDELNMRILIATKKNLYYINDVGTVVDIKKCAFIWSGQYQLTNAYLNINDDNRNLKEIAIDCLDSTCRTCIGIGYPLTIGENDKEKQIEIIEENH